MPSSSGTQTGGLWSNSGQHFSFACRGSSIAKCMEAGYKPWVSPNSADGQIAYRGKEVADQPNHLQACVRMLRADYCGDGTSHTIDGRKVEFWDSMGVHKNTRGWKLEATWGPEGMLWTTGSPRVLFEDEPLPACFGGRTVSASYGHLYDPERMKAMGVLLTNAYERQVEVERDGDGSWEIDD
ncbi:MAG: ADYC domain-containing protein [Myxococcota bacterium]